MTTTPPVIVDGAPRTQFPFGLFSVFSDRGAEAAEGRWVNNVQWMPLSCDPASGIGEICPPSGGVTGLPISRSGGSDQLIDTAAAFTIYSEYRASDVGRPFTEAQERATAALYAREQARVEQAIWSGDLGNTPNLQGATDYTSGGAVAAAACLALLEDHIAQTYGSLGVIHVTRGGLAVLGQNNLIEKAGQNMLVTKGGTPVVAGAGYPGTDPSGSAPTSGEAWAYATPALFGYRSDVITSSNRQGDLLDRGQNDLYAVAMRTYLIGWDDCGVGAARFTLGCC